MTLIDTPPRPRVTPEELARTPDSSTMELVDGRIVEKLTSMESSATEMEILVRIATFLRTHPIARVFPASLGYQCFRSNRSDPDRVRKLDCTVIRNDRLTTFADRNPDFVPIVPDLAVEVICPMDRVEEYSERVIEFQTAGFPLVWVVNPNSRMVTVNPLAGKPYILWKDDEITAAGVLPGFACKVSELFPLRG